jgi:hypothetical protein
METKFTPTPCFGKFAVFFLCLVFQNCNIQNEAKGPDQILIEKLTNRFKNKDYVTSRSLSNPYDQIGIDIAEFRKEISSDPDFHKFIRLQNFKKPKFLQASLFQFASTSNEETWGIESTEVLQLAMSKIQETKEGQGKSFDREKIDQINDRLVSYSKDASGVNEMLNDGFSEKGLNEVQSKILKMTLSQISKADIHETNLINTTVEHEVINSGISETDKAFILSINSIIAHDFEIQFGHLHNGAEQSQIFKKTAQVIIFVASAAAVGAIAGGLVGVIGCCGSSNTNSCTWNCVADNIYDGAMVGLAAAMILI